MSLLSNVLVESSDRLLNECLRTHEFELNPLEIGTVTSVDRGVLRVAGLPDVRANELLRSVNGASALAFKLDRDSIGAVVLDEATGIRSGDEVHRERRLLEIPVSDSLVGRVIDPLGRSLDGLGPIHAAEHRICDADAPAILDRLPVTVPLQTGIKVVDALVPIGRGQRQLIIGDRQTGKTSIAVDAILNQKHSDVICIYCAIGQRSTAVAEVMGDLKRFGALEHSIVLVADGDSGPGLQFVAPYSAMAIGEHFMHRGHDVLVVFDDLTTHARSYRELSLLLRRPPGREAFPGDVFYLHSRLLERSTHLCDRLGGGSLTTLAVAETNAGNLADYIPTNLISITDGQICLSTKLFQLGQLPAVDIGRSVSRVGGKTQRPAYRSVAADLRLSFSQFEELETFSRFSSRLDSRTQSTLDRGRRVREVLKQSRYATLSVAAQISSLLAVTRGLTDDIPVEQVRLLAERIEQEFPEMAAELLADVDSGRKLSPTELESIQNRIRDWLDHEVPRP